MRQAALGVLVETVLPVVVVAGLIGYAGYRVMRAGWRDFVGS